MIGRNSHSLQFEKAKMILTWTHNFKMKRTYAIAESRDTLISNLIRKKGKCKQKDKNLLHFSY